MGAILVTAWPHHHYLYKVVLPGVHGNNLAQQLLGGNKAIFLQQNNVTNLGISGSVVSLSELLKTGDVLS